MEKNPQVKMIDRASVIHLVAKAWRREMESNGITLRSRQRKQVMCRYAFMVAARQSTYMTYAEIGDLMKRDHATAIHAIKQHETNMRFDSKYRSLYEIYTHELTSISQVLLEDGSVISSDDPSEIRLRLMNLSKKIRGHIIDKKELEVKLVKVRNEKDHLREHNKELIKRNDFLSEELIRIKRLI